MTVDTLLLLAEVRHDDSGHTFAVDTKQDSGHTFAVDTKQDSGHTFVVGRSASR